MDYTELINITRDYLLRDIASNERALIYRIINSEASTYRIASSKFKFRQQNSQERNDYPVLKRLIELHMLKKIKSREKYSVEV